MTQLSCVLWDVTALPLALDALTTATGMRDAAAQTTAPFASGAHLRDVEQTALEQGVEALPVALTYCQLQRQLSTLGPSLIRIGATEASALGYLAVLGGTRRHVRVVTPQRLRVRLPLGLLYEVLSAQITSQPASIIETWLDQAAVPGRRRPQVRRRLLDTLLSERDVFGIWLIRRDPGTGIGALLRAQGVVRDARQFLLTAVAQILLMMLAWLVLGRAVLQGDLATGWFWAFVLLTCSAIPLQLLSSWSAGRAGLGLAAVLKQRLLCGALRLDPAEIRSQGAGGLLAMVSESEAIERAGLEGTLAVFVAGLQLIGAALVLWLGAGGGFHALLLVLYCGFIASVMWRTMRRQRAWTLARFGLSARFVEQVQGHRTRLIQGSSHELEGAEDAALASYASALSELDRACDRLAIWPARGWFFLGVAGLTPALLGAPGDALLALSLGGIMQAQQAFGTLSQSLGSLLAACVAWRCVRPLYRAAAERPGLARVLAPESNELLAPTREGALAVRTNHPTLELRELAFGYARPGSNASRLQLHACDWVVHEGEKWLLTGASGSGKSTLVSLIAGVYRPTAGLILLDGLDRSSLGASQWRKRVASAPQFHENHILSSTLSFNLLMGRCWPPRPEDLQEASEICRALGLGGLLSRMPSGIHQLVGETGWQLSHGERSRVFLARALLQRARLVLLDESFGALDPDSLQQCMTVARERAVTLVVIAHP